MSGDEIEVVIIQVTREFAEKVHANPRGLRVWVHGAESVRPFPEIPGAVWHGTAVYNNNPAQPSYRMPTVARAK